MTKKQKEAIKKGYEDCATLLDGFALIWANGVKAGHELASEVLADAAKHIRMLKDEI